MLTSTTWEKLSQPVTGSSGLVALRLHPESRFNLFAAVDDQTGHRFLLLKSSDARLRSPTTLPSGRGFSIHFIRTPGDVDGASCLHFELTEPAHADVFDVIGNDILNHVIQARDDASAFDVFVTRIEGWQHFLDGLPHEGMSDQAQQGLFAELWFLGRILLPQVGASKAVRAWAGPQALAKDFELSGAAFEVKASASKEHTRFSISNELQLDARDGKLVLYCLLLERMVAGGTSLPELVATVRADLRQADSHAAARFSEMLLKTGYSDADALRYPMQFEVRSEHFFEVAGDFPRIVEGDLRPGVGDVKYSILRSECERYAITEAEARNLMRLTP